LRISLSQSKRGCGHVYHGHLSYRVSERTPSTFVNFYISQRLDEEQHSGRRVPGEALHVIETRVNRKLNNLTVYLNDNRILQHRLEIVNLFVDFASVKLDK